MILPLLLLVELAPIVEFVLSSTYGLFWKLLLQYICFQLNKSINSNTGYDAALMKALVLKSHYNVQSLIQKL